MIQITLGNSVLEVGSLDDSVGPQHVTPKKNHGASFMVEGGPWKSPVMISRVKCHSTYFGVSHNPSET